jgi:hypothetical protein
VGLLDRFREHQQIVDLVELALEGAALLSPHASNEFIALIEPLPRALHGDG